jgi:hypothetical protein
MEVLSLLRVSSSVLRDVRWDKAFDLLEQPEEWPRVRRTQLENTRWAGDFNYMIGPDDFVETCLPSLREQARRAGRCVLHVDGPGAANHAAAIAGAPEITAVQYTPGAGRSRHLRNSNSTESGSPWGISRTARRPNDSALLSCVSRVS